MRLRAHILLFLCAFMGVAPAGAQPIPPTCDPEVNGVINARAWMGGKRDMESAQTILARKPNDSILDISCFDGNVSRLGTTADDLFSDNIYSSALFTSPSFTKLDDYEPTFIGIFGPNPPGGPFTNLKLDNVLIALVRNALRRHLNPTFTTATLDPPPAIICTSMASVWQTSKCADFNKDWSYTFDQHRTTDQRGCPAGTRNTWNTRFSEANPLPVPRAPAAPPQPPGGLDQMVSYTGNIYPTNCSALRPVPTGMMVEYGKQAYYPDAVCAGVGCWYSPNGNSCQDRPN